jgi:sulfate adenylyltransferase subunit 2
MSWVVLQYKLVLNALVSGARKKRQAALFVKTHSLKTTNGDLQHSAAKVLVAEDGKGAKRWCLLNDAAMSSIRAGLAVLAGDKPTTFFPSGEVVSNCRELKDKGIDLQFEISIAQFSEAAPSNSTDLPKDNTTMKSQPTKLSHLDRLEAESLYIIREVMAHADNPVMLYSVGKDSAVMLHLARKAFYPSPPPFPLMHVDTRWKFQAMYDFRDIMAKESKMDLIVHTNPEGIEKKSTPSIMAVPCTLTL